jgi:hypothetical protein
MAEVTPIRPDVPTPVKRKPRDRDASLPCWE